MLCPPLNGGGKPSPGVRGEGEGVGVNGRDTAEPQKRDRGPFPTETDAKHGRTGCIYCNPRGSGTGAFARGVAIRDQVGQGMGFLAKRFGCRKFISYFQSFTNTYAPVETLERIYREALSRPDVVGLAVGTRPDCVPDPVLDLLAELARERVVWVEYGLQSVHARTLALINRGHGPETFFDAVERTHARGIEVVVHLILGLPGESLLDMQETARAVTRAGVQGVKLHPLYVVRGTVLERKLLSGSYECLSEEAAQEAIMGVLEALDPETVIHRLTSDPHAEELVAPLWMLDRAGVRTRLAKAMQARDFRQGLEFRIMNDRAQGL
ncbi:MAG: TIGR01212 family radical SAM protein [Thermodesulfobacteriota bacterium]